MKKYIFLFLILISKLSFAQQNKLNLLNDKNFNGKNAWLIDSVLCSNEFEGRKSGFIGATKAAKFIADKFNDWGLKPGGENKTYFQKFPILATEEIGNQEFVIKDKIRGDIKLREGDDFAVFTNSGSAKIESDVYFVGYGIEDSLWNDYKNIDVKGKIVLMIGGSPKKYDFKDKDDRNSKYKKACEKGAAAVLIYNFPGNKITKGAAILKENYNENVPGAYVIDWVIRELLKGTGISIDKILDQLKDNPYSFIINKKVLVNFNLKRIDNSFGENILGIIEGKEKKDEYIVIGAHMDHLGKSPSGYTYFGADDNGSGTSLIMELARVLSKKGYTKRNILFVAFGGEEQGLLGSEYFVNYPTIPKENIAVMINFDMVGVGDGGIGISGTETIRGIWNEFYNSLSNEEKKKIRTGRAGIGGTDHTAFKLSGIPALSGYSTGKHYFYHDPEDTYDYVDSTVFHSVGNIIQKLVMFLDNYDKKLVHRFRNEKNLLDGSNIFCFKKSYNLLDVKNHESIKNDLEKGVKFTKLILDGDETNFIFSLSNFLKISEEKLNYVQFVKDITEIKNNLYSSNLVVYPVVTKFNGNKDIYITLRSLGINTFEFDANVDHKALDILDRSNIILDINNFLQNNFNVSNKVFVKDSYARYKTEIKKLKEKSVNFKKILFVIEIEENQDIDELNDLIKEIGFDKVYVDMTEILNKDTKIAYEIIKKFKLLGYTDSNIQRIFGENIINVL